MSIEFRSKVSDIAEHYPKFLIFFHGGVAPSQEQLSILASLEAPVTELHNAYAEVLRAVADSSGHVTLAYFEDKGQQPYYASVLASFP